MKTFFSSDVWVIISAVISVLGLFGTVIGIYQYIKSSKELREYKYLFKVAGQHVDLEDKKNQINSYEAQIQQLQKTIKKQIPEEAKRIALKGMLDNEMLVLSSSYNKVKSLQSELNEMTSDETAEADELIGKVNKIIEPTYSRKRADSLFNTIFYLVSVVSSFLSMTLPYSTYKIIMVLALFFQLIIGVRAMVNLLKLNYTRKELAGVLRKCFWVTAIVMLAIFMIVSALFMYWSFTMNEYIVRETFYLLLALIYLAYLFFGVLCFSKAKKKMMVLWLAISLLVVASVALSILFMMPLLYIFSVCVALIDLVFMFLIDKKESIGNKC